MLYAHNMWKCAGCTDMINNNRTRKQSVFKCVVESIIGELCCVVQSLIA